MRKTIDEFRKFDPIPKVSLDKVKKAAHMQSNAGHFVSEENLPSVVYHFEEKLRAFQHKQKTKAQEWFHELQNTARTQLNKSNVEHVKNELLSITENSKKLNLNATETTLSQMHEDFKVNKQNFIDFKKIHNRSLLPVHSENVINQYLVLLGLFILEVILNYKMLKGGGATDRDAAISISLAQTTVNIVSCFILGKGLIGRIIFSEELLKKISFALIFVVHIFAIILVNANMGIFRDHIVRSAQSESLKIGAEALLTNWQWAPWDQMARIDVTAALIIGVGLILAMIAYIDGFLSDDPYPGYGKAYRSANSIKKDITKKIKEINDEYHNSINACKKRAKEFRQLGKDGIEKWSLAINSIEQVWVDYKNLLTHLNETFKRILDLYVSTYNIYHKSAKINLKKISLLPDAEYKLDLIFSDVKEFYMDDNKRQKSEKEYQKNFERDFDKLEKEIEISNNKILDRLSKISAKFPCQLS